MDPSRPVFRSVVARYTRVRAAGARDLANAAATTQPQRPDHGGATGAHGTDGAGHEDDETARKRRRRKALAAVAERLGLSREANVDIAVDVDGEHARFTVRDLGTDQVLATFDEQGFQRLVTALRDLRGSLVDRAI